MNDQNRIQIFGVPVDDIDEERFGETIRRLATDNGKHQIVFLDFRGLMRARGKGEYADMIRTASLVVPTSKSILAGARFLKLPVPTVTIPLPSSSNYLVPSNKSEEHSIW